MSRGGHQRASSMTDIPAKKAAAGRRKVELDPRLAAYKGVWVFVEHERGATHPVSWELLGEARKLADQLGVEVGAVVLGAPGPAIRRACDEAFCYGADVCYLIENPVLASYRNEPYTKGLTHLVDKYQPEIVLLGATTLGRDLGGSIATTLATGLTADCTELDHRSGQPQPGGDAADFRRQPAVHHPDPELPAADGHGTSARHAHA